MTVIVGTFATSASNTTHSFTVPSGVTSNMKALLVFGTNDSAITAGTALSSSGASFTSLDERAANNMVVSLWKGTGLTAGNTITVTLASNETLAFNHYYTDDYDFNSGAGNVAVGTRGSSSSSTTSGSLTPSSGQRVVLVALERTTATPTTVSSVTSSGGETITQIGYTEATTDPAVSIYFGSFLASAAAARTATITYSGGSTNGFAALVTTTPSAVSQTVTPGVAGSTGAVPGSTVADVQPALVSNAAGSAPSPTVAVSESRTATTAAATASALDSTVATSESRTATTAAATGVAPDPGISSSQVLIAESSAATGQALDASAAAISNSTAVAQAAVATGIASDPAVAVAESRTLAPDAAQASGSAPAVTIASQSYAAADAASATGQANDATTVLATSATVSPATAVAWGTAQGAVAATEDGGPGPTIIGLAETAQAATTAHAPRMAIMVSPVSASAAGSVQLASVMVLEVTRRLHAGQPVLRSAMRVAGQPARRNAHRAANQPVSLTSLHAGEPISA